MDQRFTDIILLIKQSRVNAIRAVNTELISLYWNIGEQISKKIERSEWGDSIVKELAEYIRHNEPEIKGFSDKNLWRMKQFYEAYKNSPKLSTLLREISWSGNLAIFSRCKAIEEREFYLLLAKKEHYSYRELDHQITAGLYERMMLGNTKLSSALRETGHEVINTFKDSYVFEFLNLPEPHNESELQRGLVGQMKKFLLELGKDFLFIGEEYRLQVGNSDSLRPWLRSIKLTCQTRGFYKRNYTNYLKLKRMKYNHGTFQLAYADHFVDVNKMINRRLDSSLRDWERIPPGTDIDQYYQREVKPHLPNSRMDRSKDKTGYEINFTKYFYKYKPLRSVEEITKDLLELEKESEGLMRGLVEFRNIIYNHIKTNYYAKQPQKFK